MTERNDFRILNEFEKSIILNSLDKICQNSAIFIKNYQERLYISFDKTSSRGLNPSIFLLSPEHPKIIEKFDKDIQITSIGLYFGFFNKESFRLSLEGAEFLLNRELLIQDHILVIDIDGEKSVLYGNDIKKGNAINIPFHLRKNDFLVINNEKNEICAIAQSLINKQDLASLNPGEIIALNLVDMGYYLRKIQ
ncbi:MAG: hypothetical protein KGD58_04760 [Candidatus Lokiarchaeota archaeon]|nr:hypothetical protein [Candidatus Lokiarchaeota archaeon]